MKPAPWTKTPRLPIYSRNTKPRLRRWSACWPPSARNRVPKGGSEKRTAAEKREYIRHCRPRGVSIAEGCRLMGIGRSTFYDMPDARARDLTIVAEMKTIFDELGAYGYRRVDAERRHRGIVVNAKTFRWLMRASALHPKHRWRVPRK